MNETSRLAWVVSLAAFVAALGPWTVYRFGGVSFEAAVFMSLGWILAILIVLLPGAGR